MANLAPHSSSDNHREGYAKVSNQQLKRPGLYLPGVESGAVEFLVRNGGCPHSTLLMLYPPTDFASFLWMIDWKTMFKGDSIMVAMSERQFEERFKHLLHETGVWQESHACDVPKYGLVQPGVTMKLRTFTRRS